MAAAMRPAAAAKPKPEPEVESGPRIEERPWGHVIFDGDGNMVGRVIKDRRLFAVDEEMSLEPNSLIGSAFLVLHEQRVLWQGVVVAEPSAGTYLCEIGVLEPEVKQVQRLFQLDTLLGYGDEARRVIEGAVGSASAPVVDPTLEWRLYDSEEAATEAYRVWAGKALARQAEEATT